MKIRTSKRIQEEVNRYKLDDISPLANLHVQATDQDTDLGVREGILLANKYKKARWKTQILTPAFGIYVAYADTDNGYDYLYFIGTPDEIIKKLKKTGAK